MVVKLGDKVVKGQYIGEYADPTNGSSTGPHLHFEHYKVGVLQDPTKYAQIVIPKAATTSKPNVWRAKSPKTGKPYQHKGIDIKGPTFKWRCTYEGC